MTLLNTLEAFLEGVSIGIKAVKIIEETSNMSTQIDDTAKYLGIKSTASDYCTIFNYRNLNNPGVSRFVNIFESLKELDEIYTSRLLKELNLEMPEQ